MLNFRDYLKEEKTNPVVFSFGRMNPPTIGHEKLINKVKQHAKEHNADHLIVASHSHDAKKNPLTADQKLHHLHRAFPGTNIQVSNKEHPSFIHQLKKLSWKDLNNKTRHQLRSQRKALKPKCRNFRFLSVIAALNCPLCCG